MHMLSCIKRYARCACPGRRFGVRQKEGVLQLCTDLQPHMLSMSATPIPRTMALVKWVRRVPPCTRVPLGVHVVSG